MIGTEAGEYRNTAGICFGQCGLLRSLERGCGKFLALFYERPPNLTFFDTSALCSVSPQVIPMWTVLLKIPVLSDLEAMRKASGLP